MKKQKVLIIGAGPAGLTAAYELLKEKEKYEVIIIEEDSLVGGISKTIKFDNNLIDTGIHRFFSKDDRVINIWKELLPLQGHNSWDDEKLNIVKKLDPNGPDPQKTDDVMLIRKRITRIYYLKKFFDYPVSLKKDTFVNMGIKRTIKVICSYIKSVFYKRKEISLEDFFINRFGKTLYQMFFEDYTEKLWGRHPSKISADWGAQRVKGLSIISVIKDMFLKKFMKNKKTKETSLIEEFWYPKCGAGQIWDKMLSVIEKSGGKILKEHKVIKINKDGNKIISIECENSGKVKEISADILISSMPIKDLVNGFGEGNVPEDILDIALGLPYREFMSVGLLVKKLEIENNTKEKTLGNVIPDSWIYVQEPDVKMGRIQIFNNWSPYLFEDPENTVLMTIEYFCDENDNYWNMSDDEFINFAIKEAEKIGMIKGENVISSYRVKVKKAYPAYFDTYKEIDKLITYLDTYSNLYCIGRNGQHRYNNMDHSMVTGIEAANNIKNNIKSRTNIWNVNTEKEYHEIKKEK